MKIWDMLKIIKKNNLQLDFLTIGRQQFYILHLDQPYLIINKLIMQLLQLKIALFWFKNYYEFETFFSLGYSKDRVNFILMG